MSSSREDDPQRLERYDSSRVVKHKYIMATKGIKLELMQVAHQMLGTIASS